MLLLSLLWSFAMQGCRVGAAAANAVLDADKNTEPVLVGLQGNRVIQSPLMDCVRKVSVHHAAVDA